MLRSFGIFGCFCLAVGAGPPVHGGESQAKSIVAQYEVKYQAFVKRFRATSGAAKRLQLVEQTSKELNALLAPRIDSRSSQVVS